MKRFLLGFAALVLSAQSQLPVLPGDVLYIDNTTERPYLWLHANTGHYELLPGFTSDQAYRLLLEREQSCWMVNYWNMRSTFQEPAEVERPKPGRPR